MFVSLGSLVPFVDGNHRTVRVTVAEFLLAWNRSRNVHNDKHTRRERKERPQSNNTRIASVVEEDDSCWCVMVEKRPETCTTTNNSRREKGMNDRNQSTQEEEEELPPLWRRRTATRLGYVGVCDGGKKARTQTPQLEGKTQVTN